MNNKQIDAQNDGEINALKDPGSYYQNQRKDMLCFIPGNPKKILDVGCATGAFSEILKSSYSAEVWGIEPNKLAAEIAKSKIDKVISDVFSTDLDLPNNYFDCIIFNDVLEHMIDPFSALKSCHKLLTSEGTVVASIPNVRYFENMWNLLIHQNWEYCDWGILDKTHLRFFTQKSIVATFKSLDFNIVNITGINPLEELNINSFKKFKYLKFFLGDKIEDMRYLQFAVTARPNKHQLID